jgi:hypothetical protein
MPLYSLVGHGVRGFGGLTCDFAEVLGGKILFGAVRGTES